MIRTLYTALLLLIASSTSLEAYINVKANRNDIKFNETVTVSFTTDEKIIHQPDFTPIESDFEIVSRQQSTNTRMINGAFTIEIGWTLTLAPKREGLLTIPPIKFDNITSKALAIDVGAPAKPAKGDPIFIDVTTFPEKEVYEQSQILLTVRLFCSVNVLQGAITEPKPSDSNASIEKLGNDAEYEKVEGGIRYHIIERSFAIYPDQAGQLTISPTIFEGQIVTGGRTMFDMQTQFIRLTSEPLTFNVKPIPAPYTKLTWLPAEDVTITDEWSQDPSKMAVGDAITRTITIKATGALAAHIPTPDLKIPPEFKQYPDKASANNHTSKEGILGIRQLKTALIPSKAGEFTLPEIQLNWWNVETNQPKTASIPAQKLKVAEAQIALATPPNLSQDDPSLAEQPPKQTESIPIWAWALLAANGLAVAAFVIHFLYKKIKPWFKPRQTSPKAILKQACLSNKAKETERALLAWVKIQHPEGTSISKLKEYFPEEIQQLLEELNTILYSNTPHDNWEGKPLWKALSKHTKKKSTIKDQSSPLPSLYS